MKNNLRLYSIISILAVQLFCCTCTATHDAYTQLIHTLNKTREKISDLKDESQALGITVDLIAQSWKNLSEDLSKLIHDIGDLGGKPNGDEKNDQYRLFLEAARTYVTKTQDFDKNVTDLEKQLSRSVIKATIDEFIAAVITYNKIAASVGFSIDDVMYHNFVSLSYGPTLTDIGAKFPIDSFVSTLQLTAKYPYISQAITQMEYAERQAQKSPGAEAAENMLKASKKLTECLITFLEGPFGKWPVINRAEEFRQQLKKLTQVIKYLDAMKISAWVGMLKDIAQSEADAHDACYALAEALQTLT